MKGIRFSNAAYNGAYVKTELVNGQLVSIATVPVDYVEQAATTPVAAPVDKDFASYAGVLGGWNEGSLAGDSGENDYSSYDQRLEYSFLWNL